MAEPNTIQTDTLKTKPMTLLNQARASGTIASIITKDGGIQTISSSTPRIVTTVSQGSRIAHITMLPDTGSTVDAISSFLVEKHKLILNPVNKSTYNIRDANGKRIVI